MPSTSVSRTNSGGSAGLLQQRPPPPRLRSRSLSTVSSYSTISSCYSTICDKNIDINNNKNDRFSNDDNDEQGEYNEKIEEFQQKVGNSNRNEESARGGGIIQFKTLLKFKSWWRSLSELAKTQRESRKKISKRKNWKRKFERFKLKKNGDFPCDDIQFITMRNEHGPSRRVLPLDHSGAKHRIAIRPRDRRKNSRWALNFASLSPGSKKDGKLRRAVSAASEFLGRTSKNSKRDKNSPDSGCTEMDSDDDDCRSTSFDGGSLSLDDLVRINSRFSSSLEEETDIDLVITRSMKSSFRSKPCDCDKGDECCRLRTDATTKNENGKKIKRGFSDSAGTVKNSVVRHFNQDKFNNDHNNNNQRRPSSENRFYASGRGGKKIVVGGKLVMQRDFYNGRLHQHHNFLKPYQLLRHSASNAETGHASNNIHDRPQSGRTRNSPRQRSSSTATDSDFRGGFNVLGRDRFLTSMESWALATEGFKRAISSLATNGDTRGIPPFDVSSHKPRILDDEDLLYYLPPESEKDLDENRKNSLDSICSNLFYLDNSNNSNQMNNKGHNNGPSVNQEQPMKISNAKVKIGTRGHKKDEDDKSKEDANNADEFENVCVRERRRLFQSSLELRNLEEKEGSNESCNQISMKDSIRVLKESRFIQLAQVKNFWTQKNEDSSLPGDESDGLAISLRPHHQQQQPSSSSLSPPQSLQRKKSSSIDDLRLPPVKAIAMKFDNLIKS